MTQKNKTKSDLGRKEGALENTLISRGSGNELVEQGEVIERQPHTTDNPLPSENLDKIKCVMWKNGKCNSMYGHQIRCDGLKSPRKCPYPISVCYGLPISKEKRKQENRLKRRLRNCEAFWILVLKKMMITITIQSMKMNWQLK